LGAVIATEMSIINQTWGFKHEAFNKDAHATIMFAMKASVSDIP